MRGLERDRGYVGEHEPRTRRAEPARPPRRRAPRAPASNRRHASAVARLVDDERVLLHQADVDHSSGAPRSAPAPPPRTGRRARSWSPRSAAPARGRGRPAAPRRSASRARTRARKRTPPAISDSVAYGYIRYSIRGNAIVSRRWSMPQIQVTTRSMPMPKPACGNGAVPPQVEVPAERLLGQVVLVDALQQQVVVGEALSPAHDLAVALGREDVGREAVLRLVGVGRHVERLDRRREAVDDHRAGRRPRRSPSRRCRRSRCPSASASPSRAAASSRRRSAGAGRAASPFSSFAASRSSDLAAPPCASRAPARRRSTRAPRRARSRRRGARTRSRARPSRTR